MGLIDSDTRSASMSASKGFRARTRPPRIVSEFESEIRQLYLRMMDEPVPPRLIGILRSGLPASKP